MSYVCQKCFRHIRIRYGHDDIMPYGGWCFCPPEPKPEPVARDVHGWIGVDLDGTLAEYSGWKPGDHSIGKPIQPMVDRVKEWLRTGHKVKIMTARVSPPTNDDVIPDIQKWCHEHIGQVLEVTSTKDYAMIELWDDRAVRVKANEGHPCCDHHHSKPSYHKIT